jgi:hypothetical protein
MGKNMASRPTFKLSLAKWFVPPRSRSELDRRRVTVEQAVERAGEASERFRLRAEEYRAIADSCMTAHGRAANLHIAALYTRLAERSAEVEASREESSALP